MLYAYEVLYDFSNWVHVNKHFDSPISTYKCSEMIWLYPLHTWVACVLDMVNESPWVHIQSLNRVWLFSLPDSSVHGIFQARVLEWIAISSPGDLSALEIKPSSPAGTGGFFMSEPSGTLPPITLSQCSFFHSPRFYSFHRLTIQGVLCFRMLKFPLIFTISREWNSPVSFREERGNKKVDRYPACFPESRRSNCQSHFNTFYYFYCIEIYNIFVLDVIRNGTVMEGT